MKMSKKEWAAAAKRSRGSAAWMVTWGVAAVMGMGVIAAGAMAATHLATTSSPGHSTVSQPGAQVTTAGSSGKQSGSDVLQLSDLPDRADLGDWAAIEPTGKGSALACVPAHVTDGLGAQASEERRFVARTEAAGDTGPYAARIGETVLQFADQATAADAMESVHSYLEDCAAPDMVGHEPSESETVKDGTSELILRSASDICTDCDAVFFDREALLHVGDRLLLVSLAVVGGPLEPHGLAASMHDLVNAAIQAAG